MHNLKPDTEYKLVSLLLAVPASLQDVEITDGLNDILNNHLVDLEDDPFVVDWIFPNLEDPFSIRKTGKNVVEEGELFS